MHDSDNGSFTLEGGSLSDYEAMIEVLDDMELLKIIKERMNEPAVRISLDDF